MTKMRSVLPFEELEPGSTKISRREALKGLGAVGVLPLLAESAAGAQQRRGSSAEQGPQSPTLSGKLREQTFDLGWRFLRGDAAGAEGPSFDDSGWRRVDLPHDWSLEDLTPPAETAG